MSRAFVSQIVILNGPPGVGKTTVLGELRALLAGTVGISGDALRAFAPADVRAHLGGGATYRAAGALARAYASLGAERVIFDYVFLRAAHFRYFSEALADASRVCVFTLWAPLETVELRARARPEPQHAGSAVADSYREMAINTAILGQIVDNAGSDPKRVAACIHAACTHGH